MDRGEVRKKKKVRGPYKVGGSRRCVEVKKKKDL